MRAVVVGAGERGADRAARLVVQPVDRTDVGHPAARLGLRLLERGQEGGYHLDERVREREVHGRGADPELECERRHLERVVQHRLLLLGRHDQQPRGEHRRLQQAVELVQCGRVGVGLDRQLHVHAQGAFVALRDAGVHVEDPHPR
eukprot:scaffold26823_cov83-Isochrysis_galbana.AAC.3